MSSQLRFHWFLPTNGGDGRQIVGGGHGVGPQPSGRPASVSYLGSVAREPKASRLHEVRLENLRAGRTYYYRVRSGDAVSEVCPFRTAPPPGPRRWRLAVYGD